VSERAKAAGEEQAAQIEEAAATIHQWQEAYEQLNLQLKSSQVIINPPCKSSVLQLCWKARR